MAMRSRTFSAVAVAAAIAFAGYYFFSESGDPTLAGFVKSKPAISIVFTSRSAPSSLRAASEIGDYSPNAIGAKSTGQPQWQANDGRLRILTPGGHVRELTYGKQLPDGAVIIDVMSPSVSPDGNTIVFAGRRTSHNGGRFRIYSVGIDGSDLKPLTGGSDDPGCASAPPLRFSSIGEKLSDAARRSLDFDDVDPALLPEGTLVFSSSRTPDTNGADRRAMQIWLKEPKQKPRPLTAGRAGDRWPYVAADRSLVFSIWGKLDDVIGADGTGLVRRDPKGLTAPTDRWFGATISPTGENFAQVAKVPSPVWRPRPLDSGNIVFMTPRAEAPTPFTPSNENPEFDVFRVGQAPLGTVTSAPSSLAAWAELPALREPPVSWLNALAENNRPYSIATPSPAPGGVFVAAAPVAADGKPRPVDYGLYFAETDGWSPSGEPNGAKLVPLFDDPDLVDAEPVAVCERPIEFAAKGLQFPTAWPADENKSIHLAGGKRYFGPAGKVENRQLMEVATGHFPGQTPAIGSGPIFAPFATGSIEKIAFYTSHRDRYDDPDQVIVPGRLEKLLEVAVDRKNSFFEATLPVGSPTLLVGLGPDGKVATAPVPGKSALFYAYAGDHVSGMRAGGYVFCTGCHTGHTFTGNSIAERRK